MTSVIFNDPSGSDYLYKFSGVQLNAPSGETLALGANAKTADNSNVILTVGDSYIRIPQGVSAERPATGYAGMIRYLTSENLIEYFNASDFEWQSIRLAPPSITSVSPTLLNQGISNIISLTGKNFNTSSNIQLIGTDSSIFTPDTVNNTLGSSNLTFTCLSGNTILDNSSVEPFYIKLTNNDTGFTTQTSPILNINQGSYFILPPGPTLGPFPVQDPCANFYIQGGDTDHPDGNDVSFAIVSANPTPGGFQLTNSTSDISATFAPAPGSRTDASAQTYNFQVQMTDSSGAKSTIQPFSFSLANPQISSINPNAIQETDLININITGNYFVIDSSISFFNSSFGYLSYHEVSYNSPTSLTVIGVSGGSGSLGQYDISVNNGSVVTSNPLVYLSIIRLEVDFLVIAGGGGGGSDNGNGGGAGGYRTSWAGSGGTEKSGGNTTVLSPLVLNVSTSYSIQVGGGGNASGTGAGQYGGNGKESYIKLGTTNLVQCDGGGGGANFSSTGNTGGSGGAKSGSGTTNQGTAGGSGSGGGYGGGGALRTGGASNTHGQAKGGGDGLTSSITGSSVTRGGGGGGGADSNSPAGGHSGGAGGGGHGTDFDGTHHDSDDRGLNRYGGGGGGGADQTHGASISNGAAGGSGTIILRYPSNFTINVTGGVSSTTTTVGSDKVTEIYANASGRGGTTSQTGTISWSV